MLEGNRPSLGWHLNFKRNWTARKDFGTQAVVSIILSVIKLSYRQLGELFQLPELYFLVTYFFFKQPVFMECDL